MFGTNTESGDPQVSSIEPIEDEEWHQVVGTLEGEGMVLYVDGFPSRLGNGQSVLPEELEEPETLVGTNPGMSYFLDGSVDQVSTYEGVLSESEVVEHLNVSKAEEPEILLAEEPETSDVDADGLTDGKDNCIGTANAGQTDDNLNGTGDACEPPDGDGDGDGVADVNDNCLDVYNHDQADANANGVGDACGELPPGVATLAPSLVNGTSRFGSTCPHQTAPVRVMS